MCEAASHGTPGIKRQQLMKRPNAIESSHGEIVNLWKRAELLAAKLFWLVFSQQDLDLGSVWILIA